MATQQDPWQRDDRAPAEKFLDYVGRAGIAVTALLTVATVVGGLVLVLPTSEAMATIVFTGLLVAVVAGARKLGRFERPPEV